MVNYVKIGFAFLVVFCTIYLAACQSAQSTKLIQFTQMQDMAQPLDSYVPRHTLDDFSLVTLQKSSLIPASKEQVASEQFVLKTSEIATELVVGKDNAISAIYHIASPMHNATFSISFLDEQGTSRRHVAYKGKEIETSLASDAQMEHFLQRGAVGWLDENTFFFGGPLVRDYFVYDTVTKTVRPLVSKGILPDDLTFLKHNGGGRMAFYSGMQAAIYLYDHDANISWMQAYVTEPPHTWNTPPLLLWSDSELLYLALEMPEKAVIYVSATEQSVTRMLSLLPQASIVGLQQNYFALETTEKEPNTQKSLFFDPQANLLYFAADGKYLGDYNGYALIRQSDRLLFCKLEEQLVYALPFDPVAMRMPPQVVRIPGDYSVMYLSLMPQNARDGIYSVMLP